ncbi:lytic transglycosylase domain-containing protein [Halalkalibacter urbisdiaboli]|uniref:lytic transglycosylase domain-containing protein n=1 Tax=Halalkalibacter urbisdiaboli TaxID=1960589 RepID=UPI000B43847F|nr:lytic transglycosylase domain-containing protein [Halalkalibacter urbisdiaboli]
MRKKQYLFIILGFIICFLIFENNSKVQHFIFKATLKTHAIPEQYIPIYQSAADEFNIPWELLASVHRVETIFSTMDPLVSPVGAVGHFQFMPRTWVGWSHPGSELGLIDENIDITDITLIESHQGYGVDASGNGIADPFDIEDATYAAAKYLADHGAAKGDLNKALFSYNQSEEYVEEVLFFYEAYIQHYELIQLPN